MSLTVEDGSGLSNSESFISVADATTYLSAYSSDSGTWAAASTSAQELALRQAARWIETQFGSRFTGRKKTATQALSWPRLGAIDPDGFAVGESSIPNAVKHAQAELAVRALAGDLLTDLDNTYTLKKERNKVGDIEEELEFASPKSQLPLYRVVVGLLKGWYSAGMQLERS